jgi:hypothetical protein
MFVAVTNAAIKGPLVLKAPLCSVTTVASRLTSSTSARRIGGAVAALQITTLANVLFVIERNLAARTVAVIMQPGIQHAPIKTRSFSTISLAIIGR